MTTFETSIRIRIDAPDAPSAFALERRLAHLHASAVGRGPDWGVELDDPDERLTEITAVTEHWLRDHGLPATTMHVDRTERTVRAEAMELPVTAGA